MTRALVFGPEGAAGVALLHGFLGCAEDMAPIARELAGAQRTITPDLPGHGPAPEPAAFSGHPFFAAVDHVVATLALEGLARFDLVGYSMGGRLACGIVARHRERVRRLVLIASSPGIEERDARARRRASDLALAQRIEREGLDRFVDFWYAQRLFGALSRHVSYPEIRARRVAGDPSALAGALVGMGTGGMPPLWDDVARAGVPLLAIAGGLDRKYVAIAGEIAARVPTARSAVIEDAGHAVHVEKPGEVSDLVRRFLLEEDENEDG